jgi:hypothetical protein
LKYFYKPFLFIFRKFVCLNDHMGNKYSDAEIARNGDVLTKFFQKYFPERSKFEIN